MAQVLIEVNASLIAHEPTEMISVSIDKFMHYIRERRGRDCIYSERSFIGKVRIQRIAVDINGITVGLFVKESFIQPEPDITMFEAGASWGYFRMHQDRWSLYGNDLFFDDETIQKTIAIKDQNGQCFPVRPIRSATRFSQFPNLRLAPRSACRNKALEPSEDA